MTKFENQNICLKELAKALINSRLTLFLGAGISMNFGLPSWDDLIKKLCQKCGIEYTSLSNERLAKLCFDKVENTDYKMNVKELLYNNYEIEKIINYPLLVALGAMLTGSNIRGKVNTIINYNYDNILESYLYYYGISPKVIKDFPYYSSNSDLKIYHPHGYLPFNDKGDSEKIVLDTSSLYQSKSDDTFWPELEVTIRHDLLLFLGISFEDRNLEELIDLNYRKHPSSSNNDAFGFYFVKNSDVEVDKSMNEEEISRNKANAQKVEILENSNIYPIYLNDWDEMAYKLAEVCQISLELTNYGRK